MFSFALYTRTCAVSTHGVSERLKPSSVQGYLGRKNPKLENPHLIWGLPILNIVPEGRSNRAILQLWGTGVPRIRKRPAPPGLP